MKKGIEKVLWVVSGAAMGVVVGAGVVLLLVPHSGEDTKALVRQRVQEVIDAGQQAAEVKRQELMSELEARQQDKA